jgi:hypothetical protein
MPKNIGRSASNYSAYSIRIVERESVCQMHGTVKAELF